VIALTAGVTQEERQRCMACGMTDFIAKPVDSQIMIARLVLWIKRAN
jgi:CheY-like chemotaxis protein